MKILVAEDEAPLREVLVDRLTQLGHTIIEADNGEQTLKLFQKEQPDLLLLDIVMPQKNGLDVLEEIRINLQSQIPILILSNLDQPQDIETATNLGANDYILKSNMSLRQLSAKISQLLPTQTTN